MKNLVGLVIFFLGFNAYAQKNFTLSGTVKDQSSGETVFGAKIKLFPINKGTITNEFGFYSISIPLGKYTISCYALGMDSVSKEIDLTKDFTLNILLNSNIKQLESIEVNAKKGENTNSTKIGQHELEIDKIKTLPAFMGEIDIIKTVQLLPGVSSASEGGQGFYVRGGGPDQNLVLLDGAQVYNASHLFGFFSVFNADALQNVNIIKGGIPANYGGRISSVLDVNMKEGNNQHFHMTGGIGLISSRLTIENPIKKDKGSFILSARRTYVDVLMKAFIPKSSTFAGTSYYFHDFNFKANYQLTKKDKIFISGYYGKDRFTYNNKQDQFKVEMPWGNAIASLRWNRIWKPKLFMNFSLNLSDYNFKFISNQEIFRFELFSGIRDLNNRIDFTYFHNVRHKMKFGTEYTFHTFTPTSVSASQEEIEFDTGEAQQLFSHESALYFLDEFDLTEKIKLNTGLRWSFYQFVGPFTRFNNTNLNGQNQTISYSKNELIKGFNGAEPRFSFRYLINDNQSIKGAGTYNYQYIHLTSLSAVSLPTDIWFPSTDKAKPQKGWQSSIGYFQDLKQHQYESSIEVYFKKMDNLIEYKNGALPQDNVNDNTDNLLVFGEGWSYGAEFFLKKSTGNLTGWIGYTWSKTERYFPDLQETVFPAKYDRRHDLSLVASFKLNENWTFGTSFIFATGNTLTLPNSWYIHDQQLLFNFGDRNSTRMANYHRFDLAATYYLNNQIKKQTADGQELIIKRKMKQNWSFSIYNVYNRANPYFLFVDNEGSLNTGDFAIKLKQVSLFPILPSITWNFELQ